MFIKASNWNIPIYIDKFHFHSKLGDNISLLEILIIYLFMWGKSRDTNVTKHVVGTYTPSAKSRVLHQCVPRCV